MEKAEFGACCLGRKVPDVLLEEQDVPLIHCLLLVSSRLPKKNDHLGGRVKINDAVQEIACMFM